VSAESTTWPTTEYDIGAAPRALLDEGITAYRGAFSRDWVAKLREDVDAAFEEARGREGGAVGRGPQRWYVEVHPQAFRGFVDLVDHPRVRGVCEAARGRTTRSWNWASTHGSPERSSNRGTATSPALARPGRSAS